MLQQPTMSSSAASTPPPEPEGETNATFITQQSGSYNRLWGSTASPASSEGNVDQSSSPAAVPPLRAERPQQPGATREPAGGEALFWGLAPKTTGRPSALSDGALFRNPPGNTDTLTAPFAPRIRLDEIFSEDDGEDSSSSDGQGSSYTKAFFEWCMKLCGSVHFAANLVSAP